MAMLSGPRPANDEGSMRLSMARSYGTSAAPVEGQRRMFVHMLVLGLLFLGLAGELAIALPAGAQTPEGHGAKPIKLVVLGASLTAGYGLPGPAAFPAQLQKSLKSNGIDVDMINAGVSGDTSSGGRDRLDWSVPDGTDAVIVELGANDALRGIDPKLTKTALDTILNKLKERHIAVLLAGMEAPRNMGSDYVRAFDAIYPALASTHPVAFYPFFLDGVATD